MPEAGYEDAAAGSNERKTQYQSRVRNLKDRLCSRLVSNFDGKTCLNSLLAFTKLCVSRDVHTHND